eukprot:SAG11_NODE_5590_length_1515_cov_3.376412_2_plen_98_part_00
MRRWDIWAVAVSLFQLLANVVPFEPPSHLPDRRHIIQSVLYDTSEAPSCRDVMQRKGLEPCRAAVADVIARGLRKTIEERTPNAEAMLAELVTAICD